MCKNIEVDGPLMTRHRELGLWTRRAYQQGHSLSHSMMTLAQSILHLLSYVMLSMPQTGFISCVQMQLSCIAAMQGPSNATLVLAHCSASHLLGNCLPLTSHTGPPPWAAHVASHESLSFRLLQLADARSRERRNPDTKEFIIW